MHERDRRPLAPEDPPDDIPHEDGVFATEIPPIVDTCCTGCHGVVAPSRGLVLTGVAPSQVWRTLVAQAQAATETPMLLVEPAFPTKSWLMRKLTGDFNAVMYEDCESPMPPAGVGPSEAEVGTMRAWIAAGANP